MMSDDRPCTCPPMERPHPCARKFALSECKAATILDPVVYRWRHQKDEVWKYGHQPQHLVPPRGKELIGYYIVQPLYTADAIEALQAECERLREELAAAQERLDAVREIYAGMDGFIPQTAAEAYCLRIIREMAYVAMAQEKRDE